MLLLEEKRNITVSFWTASPDTTMFADEGYFVPRYPRHIARAFLSVRYDESDSENGDEPQPPYVELMGEAIESFARRWGGLDDSTFLRVLQEGTGRDRLVAIFAIGQSMLPQSVDLLAPLLQSIDQLERYAAACCLGFKYDERALPALKDYLLSQLATDEQGFLPPGAEYWYDTYRPHIALLLATWGPPVVVPVLRQAFLVLWEREQKEKGPYYHDAFNAFCYALGRRGAFSALHGVLLSPPRRRLTMIYLVLGGLRAAERFQDLALEMLLNHALQRVVENVLAEQFALSSEEIGEIIKQYGEDEEKMMKWYE